MSSFSQSQPLLDLFMVDFDCENLRQRTQELLCLDSTGACTDPLSKSVLHSTVHCTCYKRRIIPLSNVIPISNVGVTRTHDVSKTSFVQLHLTDNGTRQLESTVYIGRIMI